MMNGDLVAAKKILDSGKNAVLCYKGLVLTSNKSGITPLLEFLDSKMDFHEFASAYKKIGILEAIIFIKLNIKDIFTYSISNEAKKIFDSNNINCMYLENVDINLSPAQSINVPWGLFVVMFGDIDTIGTMQCSKSCHPCIVKLLGNISALRLYGNP